MFIERRKHKKSADKLASTFVLKIDLRKIYGPMPMSI
jgi:hypothetical protein